MRRTLRMLVKRMMIMRRRRKRNMTIKREKARGSWVPREGRRLKPSRKPLMRKMRESTLQDQSPQPQSQLSPREVVKQRLMLICTFHWWRPRSDLKLCFCCVFTERHSDRSQTHGKIIDFVSAKQREISQKVAKKQKQVLHLHNNLIRSY